MSHQKGRSPFFELAAQNAREEFKLPRANTDEPRVLELHPRTTAEPILMAGCDVRIHAITEPAAIFEHNSEAVRLDFVRDEKQRIIGIGLWFEAPHGARRPT